MKFHLPSLLNFVYVESFVVLPHDVSERTKEFDDFLPRQCGSLQKSLKHETLP